MDKYKTPSLAGMYEMSVLSVFTGLVQVSKSAVKEQYHGLTPKNHELNLSHMIKTWQNKTVNDNRTRLNN